MILFSFPIFPIPWLEVSLRLFTVCTFFVMIYSECITEQTGYWLLLARQNVNITCAECESTLIPLNNTFVVPGGRFVCLSTCYLVIYFLIHTLPILQRENYYWDSYFIRKSRFCSYFTPLTFLQSKDY